MQEELKEGYQEYLRTFMSTVTSPRSPHVTALPVPLDLQTGTSTQKPGEGEVRWGIMGSGRVCHDFVQALKSVAGAKVVAVGASSIDKASKFAKLHQIPRAYGTYEEVAADSDVDIVYVGTMQANHKEHAMLALDNGKHLLVEKPAACTGRDVEEMVKKAQERQVFFLEGMWTRFFPATEMTRTLINSGEIGKVVAIQADFGFNASDHEVYPDSPFYQHSLGGGGLLFVGVYPLAVVPMVYGPDMPKRIAAAGIKDEPTGVDLAAGITLEYEGKGIAVLTYNLQGETPEETTFIGTEGRIKIHGPAHCPTKLTLTKKHKGRGNVDDLVLSYEIPEPPPAVTEAGGFNYPNSNGFQYEAAAVQRCILSGYKAAPQYTPQETLAVAKIMDEVRRQLGVEDVRSTR